MPTDETSVVVLSDLVEQLLTEKPSKKNKQIYKTWQDEVNGLIRKCNQISKIKMYGEIK